jgi:hypothetical protein
MYNNCFRVFVCVGDGGGVEGYIYFRVGFIDGGITSLMSHL